MTPPWDYYRDMAARTNSPLQAVLGDPAFWWIVVFPFAGLAIFMLLTDGHLP